MLVTNIICNSLISKFQFSFEKLVKGLIESQLSKVRKWSGGLICCLSSSWQSWQQFSKSWSGFPQEETCWGITNRVWSQRRRWRICSSRNGENILVPESHSCRRNTWRSPYGRWPSLEGESFLKETRTGSLRPFSTGLVQLTRWSSTTSFSLSHNSWDLSFGNWGDWPVIFSWRHTSHCAIWVVWVYISGVRWIWSGGWLLM